MMFYKCSGHLRLSYACNYWLDFDEAAAIIPLAIAGTRRANPTGTLPTFSQLRRLIPCRVSVK